MRSFAPAPEFTGYPVLFGVLSDGSMVGTGAEGSASVARPPTKVLIAGPEGRPATLLGEFPGVELTPSGNTAIFGRNIHVHASEDRIAVGNDDQFSVRVYTRDGQLLRVVRVAEDPTTVSAEDFEVQLREYQEKASDDAERRMIEAWFEEPPRVPTFPAYSDLRLDNDGNLWVQRYHRPGAEAPGWLVFDSEGRLKAQAETPSGMTIFEIGSDYILGLSTDELGIERVQMYRLSKQPG